jgi:hypothetical protein
MALLRSTISGTTGMATPSHQPHHANVHTPYAVTAQPTVSSGALRCGATTEHAERLLELEDRLAALTAEVARAQARYDRQKVDPPAHSGFEHTVYWLDLAKRKLAAAQAGRPGSWRRHGDVA